MTPASRATAAAASSARCGVAIMRTSAPASRGSPGFRRLAVAGFEHAPDAGGELDAVAREDGERVGAGRRIGHRRAATRCRSGRRRARRRSAASRRCAGWHAAASRPPLIADRCLRTQFISSIVAPDLSSARLTSCLSSSVRPGAGSASSAEPPPEIRQARDRPPSGPARARGCAARRRDRPRRAPGARPRRPRCACSGAP